MVSFNISRPCSSLYMALVYNKEAVLRLLYSLSPSISRVADPGANTPLYKCAT